MKCPACNGKGTVKCVNNPPIYPHENCPKCGGKRYHICPKCKGKGYVDKN